MKKLAQRILRQWGYELYKLPATAPAQDGIPDEAFYSLNFSPWKGFGVFNDACHRVRSLTLVSADRCYVLHTLARQTLQLSGDFWECGVYRGGTARLLAELVAEASDRRLHLFDMFAGLPPIDAEKDLPQRDFTDTSADAVRDAIGHRDQVVLHPGLIPQTFGGMNDARVALAHIDVDIYRSIQDRCGSFILECAEEVS